MRLVIFLPSTLPTYTYGDKVVKVVNSVSNGPNPTFGCGSQVRDPCTHDISIVVGTSNRGAGAQLRITLP